MERLSRFSIEWMKMGMAKRLQKELYGETATNRQTARELLEYAKSPEVYGVAAELAPRFSNPEPMHRDVDIGFDPEINGTDVQAYVTSPREIAKVDPIAGAMVGNEIGYRTRLGLNYKKLVHAFRKSRDYVKAVLCHEYTHLAQGPGKFLLKGLHAYTPEGRLNVGEALVEGDVESSLAEAGYKPPTKHWEEKLGKNDPKPRYVWYRKLVDAIKKVDPTAIRDMWYHANRGDINSAVIRLNQPHILDTIIEYAKPIIGRRPAYAHALS